MHAEYGRDPAGRAAGARDQPHRGIEGQRIGFKPAEGGGLEQPEEPRSLQGLDGIGGHDPAVLGLLGAIAQDRQ